MAPSPLMGRAVAKKLNILEPKLESLDGCQWRGNVEQVHAAPIISILPGHAHSPDTGLALRTMQENTNGETSSNPSRFVFLNHLITYPLELPVGKERKKKPNMFEYLLWARHFCTRQFLYFIWPCEMGSFVLILQIRKSNVRVAP